MGLEEGQSSAFTNEVEDQILQECESRKMKVDEIYVRMNAVLLKEALRHNGLKAVGMAGRCLDD